MAEAGLGMTPLPAHERLETIPGVFCARAAADGDGPALWVRRAAGFEPLTWNELADDVRRTAAALLELGAAPGDRVVQISPNRYEWIATDLAIQLARAVHVPIHVSLSAPQIAYQILDSGAKVVVLAGPDQASKLADQAARFSPDLVFVSFDPCRAVVGPFPVRLLSDLAGRTSAAAARAAERHARDDARADDLATILYTSGTTGEPKGVMLNQRNLVSNATATLAAFGQRSDDLRLTWLPLSHIFARTCDLYTWIAAGSELALADSPEAVVANCGQLQPTLINGVPYFFEKVQRYLTEQGLAGTPGSLRRLLGGRLRAACSGGAPLPDHVARFYHEQGVLLVQGYGLTESSPVISTETERARKLGTVGRPIPGVEVMISAEGEILTRGPHVMLGYWNRPEATREALCDGWLRTGDLGQVDDEGYLRITGRKKELIVTSGGKNIAPAYLESLLTADPLIQQAVVLGDGRNYLTALLVPDRAALQAELHERGIALGSPGEALGHPAVLALYTERIGRRLAEVSDYEQVRKFALLDRPWSVERGELTLTLKLRRQAILANFAAAIEAMYGNESPVRAAVAPGGETDWA